MIDRMKYLTEVKQDSDCDIIIWECFIYIMEKSFYGIITLLFLHGNQIDMK